MDTNQWLQVLPIVSTAIFAAATLWLSIKQYLSNNKSVLREEYKFAKSFFEEVAQNPLMHQFPRLKGYQAIAGIHTLPPAIIKHLMDFADPVDALNDYSFSKSYLKDTPSLNRRRLNFASRFLSTEKKQIIWRWTFFAGSLAFYIFAFTPLFFATLELMSVRDAGYISILTFPIGIFLTVALLRESIQIRRAMHLIKNQNKLALTYEHVDDRDDDERD